MTDPTSEQDLLAELTDDEEYAVDWHMSEHSYGHKDANTYAAMSCAPECRRQALAFAFQWKVLEPRRTSAPVEVLPALDDLTSAEVLEIDQFMDSHMYRHTISNSYAGMSCNSGCRSHALALAFERHVLKPRRAALEPTVEDTHA